MGIEDLKIKLLKTKIFIDNEYLDKYCELILQNCNQKKITHKTQIHHVLPKCYFTFIGEEIDNSNSNLVNLLYKDHILAHYYLCMCTEGEIKGKLVNAFFHLTSRKWKLEDFDPEKSLENYQELYEEWVSQIPNVRKGMAQTEEAKQKISKNMVGKNKGKKRSEEWISQKAQMLIGNQYRKGHIMSEESKQKISASNSGRKYSETSKQLISQKKTGYKYSEESKQRMRDAKRPSLYKKVRCIELDMVFESITAARKYFTDNPNNCTVSFCINGRQKTAFGYHWELVED